MSIEIIMHPAKTINLQPMETFQRFADRIYDTSRVDVEYADGAKILVEPGYVTSLMGFKLERFLTLQEFVALKEYLENAPTTVLPAGLVKSVATPFDIPTLPELPAEFADGPAGNITVSLDGQLRLLVERAITQEEEEPPIE